MSVRNAIKHTAMLYALLLPSVAIGAPDWTCIEPALLNELDLKLDFQDDFAETVSVERPDFAEVASLGAEASKVSFSMRLSRIVWLWENDPERFAEPDAFWVLEWGEDDMDQWLDADPSNLAQEARFEKLQASLRDHPNLPEFRSYVSDNRTVSPYLELYTAFGDEIRAARDSIASCYSP